MAGNLNPMQLLMLLKSGNPQQVAQQIILNNFADDPQMQNLLKMGETNDINGITQYAQQLFSQKGMDFNQEYDKFMSMLKNL